MKASKVGEDREIHSYGINFWIIFVSFNNLENTEASGPSFLWTTFCIVIGVSKF